MRVLVTTSALEGHFFPMVPLAWALRSQGHDVLVSAPANFSGRITNAGLFAANLVPPIEFDQFMLRNRAGRPLPIPKEPTDRKEFSGRAWGRLAAHSLDATVRVVESFRPDLVLSEPNEYTGPLVAAARDIPCVEHGWGIMAMPEWKPAANMELAEELAALGQPEIPEPALRIDNCPSGLQWDPPADALPMRYVPYNGSGVIPDWVLAGRDRPVALITMGSLFPRFGLIDFVAILREFAEALPSLGVDVVVGLADDIAAKWDTLPVGVRTAGWVPLNVALPASVLIVHHGGAGSTMTSALAGKPQLILPRVVDQFGNAERVVRVGAALAVQPDELSRATVVERCALLLGDPTYAENAAKIVAENVARPTPAEVAAELARRFAGA